MFACLSLCTLSVGVPCSGEEGFFAHPLAEGSAVGEPGDAGFEFSSMTGAARFRRLHDQILNDYPASYKPTLRRVVLGLVFFSDGGLVTRSRSGHPILIALANHLRVGRNSKCGKVHADFPTSAAWCSACQGLLTCNCLAVLWLAIFSFLIFLANVHVSEPD